MAVIDWWNLPLILVVFFFALCLLLLARSIAGITCCACHSSGTFFSMWHTHTHFSFFLFCNVGSDRLMKRSSLFLQYFSLQRACCYLKYCRYRLSCLLFIRHFLFIVTHSHTRVRARTHTHTHTHARAHTHTHTHAHTHTHTHTHTRTHTHCACWMGCFRLFYLFFFDSRGSWSWVS